VIQVCLERFFSLIQNCAKHPSLLELANYEKPTLMMQDGQRLSTVTSDLQCFIIFVAGTPNVLRCSYALYFLDDIPSHSIPFHSELLIDYLVVFNPEDAAGSVAADDRCNLFEARSCGRLATALASTPEFCFWVESISSIDRLRPTRILLLLLLLLVLLRFVLSCFRGDVIEVFLLLRVFFRLMLLLDVEIDETLRDEDEDTLRNLGIFRGSTSFCPSSSLSSSPDS